MILSQARQAKLLSFDQNPLLDYYCICLEHVLIVLYSQIQENHSRKRNRLENYVSQASTTQHFDLAPTDHRLDIAHSSDTVALNRYMARHLLH